MLEQNADFHLWIEDDAIVYDTECNVWATTLGSGDVGIYRDNSEKQMINMAYFLSTKEFDQRLRQLLCEFHKNMNISQNKGKFDEFKRQGNLIEHMFWRAARDLIYLGPDKVIRHHPHPTPYKKTGKDVREWLKKNIPNIEDEDLDVLQIDFDD